MFAAVIIISVIRAHETISYQSIGNRG